MLVATFNVENLFERPRAMNLPKWSEGQPALNAASELNALFNHHVYTAPQQRRMLHLMKKFGLLAARSTNAFLTLRTVRGALVERKQGKSPRIVATRPRQLDWLDRAQA